MEREIKNNRRNRWQIWDADWQRNKEEEIKYTECKRYKNIQNRLVVGYLGAKTFINAIIGSHNNNRIPY